MKYLSKLRGVVFAILLMIVVFPISVNAAPVKEVALTGKDGVSQKYLNDAQPYLLSDGTLSATGVLGTTAIAHLNTSTGVLTLQGYNNGRIVVFAKQGATDLTIKLNSDISITTNNAHPAAIEHHGGGNLIITSDSSKKLTINMTSSGNTILSGISSYDSSAKIYGNITLSGNVSVLANINNLCTSSGCTVSSIRAANVSILNDASLVASVKVGTTKAGNARAIEAKNALTINTNGEVFLDASESAGDSFSFGANMTLTKVAKLTLKWKGSETSGAGSIIYDSDKFSVNKSTPFTEVFTPASTGTPLTYSVTLNKNGGTGGSSSVQAANDEPMPAITIPSMSGYTFRGYFSEISEGIQYYKADGSSAKNYDQATAMTLYAQWIINKYALSVTGGVGSGSYEYKSTVTITAGSAPTGKEFDKWVVTSGGVTLASVTSKTTTFTMPAGGVVIEATYKDAPPSTFGITITGDGNGTSSANVSFAKKDDVITLTAIPNTGYKFKGWIVQNGSVILADTKSASTTFKMPASAVAIKGEFELISYTVTVTSGTGSGSYTSGQTVSITASAAPPGKIFDKWTTSDGVTFANASAMSTAFTMQAKDISVGATYKDAPPSTFGITITNDGNGTAKAGVSSASSGEIIILVATPNVGYTFKSWQVVSGSVSISDNKFTMPSSTVTIKANFEKIPTYTVTVKDGTVDKMSAMAGETITITASVAPVGKTFDKWITSDGVTFASVSAMSTTFIMPSKNVTVSATYKSLPPSEYSISIINDGGGKGNANVTSAKPGDTVTLSAKPSKGYIWVDWDAISGGVAIKDNKFIMPAEAVIIEAIFEVLPNFNVFVINGTANKTSATLGQTIIISAGIAPDGEMFDRWSSSAGVYIENPKSMNTMFYMPGKDVTLTAEYKPLPEGEKAIILKTDEGGTVKVDPSAKPGDKVKLIPSSKPGYKILGYQVKDGDIKINNDEFIMPEGGIDIEAMFAPIFGDTYGLNDFLANWWWLLLTVFVFSIPMGLYFRKFVIKPNKKIQTKRGELA